MSSNNNEKSEQKFQASGIGAGSCFGTAFGLICNNPAIGIGAGLCLGLAPGTAMDKDKKYKSNDEDSDKKEK